MTNKILYATMLIKSKHRWEVKRLKQKSIHKPYNKFKGKLREKELTYRDLAGILGISEVSVNHKINGTSDFFISEAKTIEQAYGISVSIFFAE